MKFYRERILPWLIDRSLSDEAVSAERREALAKVSGIVLEIGLGTGLNLPWYPSGVERLIAVEPSEGMLRRARERIDAAPFPVEIVSPGPDGCYPLEEDSVDSVVTTLTLCTIPDPRQALAEFRRVLKPGGAYFFLEHGLNPSPGVSFFQNLLNPLQKRIAGGCNLNRPIDLLVQSAGFGSMDFSRYTLPKELRMMATLYRGVARK